MREAALSSIIPCVLPNLSYTTILLGLGVYTIYFTDSQIPSDMSTDGVDSILRLAQQAEKHNYNGVLIYFNHSTYDPITLASYIIQHTKSLIPLIATQPNYYTPVMMARAIQSFHVLYNRKVDLNMIIGANPTELMQISDNLNHRERYERVKEFIEVLRLVLTSQSPVHYKGTYYHLNGLEPLKMDKSKLPTIYIAGSSTDGLLLSEIADISVIHPEPLLIMEQEPKSKQASGIRIGVIARNTRQEAWEAAYKSYSFDRRSIMSTRFKKNSESKWTSDLARIALASEKYDDVYWLGAYLSGSPTPFLVGDYDSVSNYLYRYVKLGIHTILLNTAEDEFNHTSVVINNLKSSAAKMK